MNTPKERILLVENDPEVCDLISRQTLQPLGYRVLVVAAAGQAIQEAVHFSPDAILASLNLPGLSGKDLLVALSSQGIDVPVIVIADKSKDSDVIQAFRLGAADYLKRPIREAEVVSAVERVLKQVRARRERELLARQLNQTNQELQRRVRELTTIFALGKAVTSITDQRTLLDKIIEGAVYVTEADSGWLLLRDDRTKTFLLSACRNLPKSIMDKVNQPWEDGISSLVALSGEPLSIYGEPLKRFKVAMLGQSALVIPVKAKKEVIGLLVVVRKSPQPFGSSNQTLLEAVADYASISLLNSRLFKALEERARIMQQAAESSEVGEQIKDEILKNISLELSSPLKNAGELINQLLAHQKGPITNEQLSALLQLKETIFYLSSTAETIKEVQKRKPQKQITAVDLSDLARQAISHFQPMAHQGNVTILAELPSNPVLVHANPSQIARVFESLLSNAIKSSRKGGLVTIRIECTADGASSWAHALVKDSGTGIDQKDLNRLFESSAQAERTGRTVFSGLGIGISLVKEIIGAHGGKVWVESDPGKGTAFHFSLQAVPQKQTV